MKKIITLKNVSKVYPGKGGKSINAISDISFSIYEGEVVGLLGPNGAGKSTIIKMICGLTIPEFGDIIYNQSDRNISNISLGVVLEGNRNLYWNMTVMENIRFILALHKEKSNKKKEKIKYFLDEFNLSDKKNELVSNLSRGMQQKTAIMISFLLDTDLLLLDEPTLGLDVQSKIDMKDFLLKISEEYHKTILISSHDMRFIDEVCARVIILNKGKIITDNSIINLKEYYKINIYEINYIVDEKSNIKFLEELVKDKSIVKHDRILNKVFINDVSGDCLEEIIVSLRDNYIQIIGVNSKEVEMEDIFLKLVEDEV